MEKCGQVLRDISNGQMMIACDKCCELDDADTKSYQQYFNSMEQFSKHFIKHYKLQSNRLQQSFVTIDVLETHFDDEADAADDDKDRKEDIIDINLHNKLNLINPIVKIETNSVIEDDNYEDSGKLNNYNEQKSIKIEEKLNIDNKIKIKEQKQKLAKKRNKAEHPCKECGEIFSSYVDIKKHKHTKHLTCHKCNKTFSNRAALFQHNSQTHNSHVCETCGQTFNRRRLISHFPCHQQIKTLPCPKCNMLFHNNERLKSHMRKVHTERRIDCSECDTKFKLEYQRRDHFKRCHSNIVREKKHLCSVCNKRFEFPYELAEHARMHTGEKPLHCPICYESYSRRAEYGKHMKKFHPEYKKPNT